MLEEPQVTTSLVNQEDNYTFPSSSNNNNSSPPTIDGEDIQELPSSTTTATVQNIARRIRNRKESITRGTASSLAKMVRPPISSQTPTYNDTNTTRNSLRLSKRQSLIPVNYKNLYPYNNTLSQRRSSWTPLVQQQQQQQRQQHTDMGASSVSPSPSPPLMQCSRKKSNQDMSQQQQAKMPALHTLKSSYNGHYQYRRAHQQQTSKNDPCFLSDVSSSNTTENSSSHGSGRSIVNAPKNKVYCDHSQSPFEYEAAIGVNKIKQTMTKPSHNKYLPVCHNIPSQQQHPLQLQPGPPCFPNHTATANGKGYDNATCFTAARHPQQQNSSFETPPPCFAPDTSPSAASTVTTTNNAATISTNEVSLRFQGR
ncbi:hypothetical protein BDF20DRAFT_888245 [Mycotypha africana]|uniref:uncharacterized protein n=1 Tax=Mycotypha africana TaxID=64632 RepID=UPI002300F71F|nr:uncharacterized protein BDF20DRAFT_888245 [Mycotypha africana]KAI8972055.1 hypothetical protein BDF20DRAFT_888245 [Mycotypha africana]